MKSISSWNGPSALSPKVNPMVLTCKCKYEKQCEGHKLKRDQGNDTSVLSSLCEGIFLCTTLSSQTGCWSSCTLPRCVRKNLEKGICRRAFEVRLINVFDTIMPLKQTYIDLLNNFTLKKKTNKLHLNILPVGPSSGIQEITVYVILLVREVCFC